VVRREIPVTLPQSRIISNGVCLTRLSDGIELYFPPFRAAGAALSLGLFGLACLIPGLFAALAVAPLAVSDASGMIAIWLMSIFILPFIAFGVLFLALAGYRLTNSLKVIVTSSYIRTLRGFLGFPLWERRVIQGDISALDPVAAGRYRWLRDAVPLYDLVVRAKTSAGRDWSITVAERLRGEDLMEQLRVEIAAAARLDRSV